jgi:hypothetical protein
MRNGFFLLLCEIGVMPTHLEQNKPAETPQGFIDESQLQRLLPLSRRTLANHRKSGKLPFVRLGRRNLYHFPSVEATLLRLQQGVSQ